MTVAAGRSLCQSFDRPAVQYTSCQPESVFRNLLLLARQVFTDTVPSDLADLWNAKSAQQKAVIRLCAAVRAGDTEQLKVRHADHCRHNAAQLRPAAVSAAHRALLCCAQWPLLMPSVCMPLLSRCSRQDLTHS